jgi:SWI/SNF-related matrix-associated actin-dependent regulator of chromatin subfamily A-like protein 1
MKLKFKHSRFEVYDYTKKLPGFTIDPETDIQYTIDPQVAMSYQHYADEKTSLEIYKQFYELKTVIDQSRALDSNIFIPAPIGCSYLPFQNACATFAIPKKRILIADEMGVGKTVEAIEIMNYFIWIRYYKVLRGLIVCPNHLKDNWEMELLKWLIEEHGIEQATSSYWPMYAQFVICNYDQLIKHYENIRMRPWEFLIVDESQNLSNSSAQRTKMVCGSPAEGLDPIPCDRAIFLSGTPFNNRPIELFPTLHFLDPERWPSRTEYGVKYCDGKKSRDGKKWDFKGSSNLPELQGKLRSTVMIRRLKDEVLKDLPPKRRQIIELPAGAELLEFIKMEIDAWDSYESKMVEAKEKAKNAKELNNTEEYKNAMQALRYTESIRFSKIAEFRLKTGLATLPFAIEHLKDVLATGKKVICFGHHHDVLEPIFKEFKDIAVIVYGGSLQEYTPTEAAIKFQTDPSCQLFIGSNRMMTGLTLIAAEHEVFVELDWTPSVMKQAEDRAHRVGQKESILIQYLVLAKSLAARMAHKIKEKLELQEQTLDHDEVLEQLEEVVL